MAMIVMVSGEMIILPEIPLEEECLRQGLHGQPRCMVLASDEWRLFNIGYTNHHYELLPLLCYNHALASWQGWTLLFFCRLFSPVVGPAFFMMIMYCTAVTDVACIV
ncbi:hypothetical protein ZWY2020_023698 [Hordeum vulgare]|nr:hypothetical protein ZWY2020_023698 [Hordeum vulgare]